MVALEGHKFKIIAKPADCTNSPQIGEQGILVSYHPRTGGFTSIVLRPNYGGRIQYPRIFVKAKEFATVGGPATAANTVGYPFRCIREYDAQGVKIKELEEGYIEQFKTVRSKILPGSPDYQDLPAVLVAFPASTRKAWVPAKILHVGSRKYTDGVEVKFEDLPSVRARKITGYGHSNQDYPITFLLMNLFGNLYQRREHFKWFSSAYYRYIETGPKCLEQARLIAQAVHRADHRLSDGFKPNSKWPIRTWVRNATKINTTDGDEEGIYLRLYSNFKADSELAGSKPKTYVGKSIHMAQRQCEHNQVTKSSESGHYKIARQANKRETIKLCVFREHIPDAQLNLAEQAMMLLFRSCRSNIREALDSRTASTSVADPNPDEIDEVEASIQLLDLGEKTWGETAWGNYLETADGCNRNSSIRGEPFGHGQTLWTMYEHPDRFAFHRPSFLVKANGLMFSKETHSAKTKKKRDFSAYTYAVPTGEKAYTVIEIMKPGHGRHAQHFARLPDFGTWNNWEDALQLGIKAKWQDPNTKEWKQQYLEIAYAQSFQETEPGELESYMDMICLRNFLQRKVMNPLPDWFNNWGLPALVKKVSFDFLAQTWEVKNPDPVMHVPPPVMDEPKFRHNLLTRGFTNYGARSSVVDFRTLATPGSRKNCDYCWLYHNLHSWQPDLYSQHTSVKCDAEAGQCRLCRIRGHKCTFTHVDTLVQLHNDIYPYPRNQHNNIATIEDPGISFFEPE